MTGKSILIGKIDRDSYVQGDLDTLCPLSADLGPVCLVPRQRAKYCFFKAMNSGDTMMFFGLDRGKLR
jgi:hypothetical protein